MLKESLFVRDIDAIADDLKFTYRNTCWSKYFGLCQTADRPIWRQLNKLNTRFLSVLEESSWYRIVSTGASEDDPIRTMYQYVALVRSRDPKITVCLDVIACGLPDGRIELEIVPIYEVGDDFHFRTTAMLAKEFIIADQEMVDATRVKTVTVEKCNIQSHENAFHIVSLVHYEHPVVVYTTIRARRGAASKDATKEPPAPDPMSDRFKMFADGLAGLAAKRPNAGGVGGVFFGLDLAGPPSPADRLAGSDDDDASGADDLSDNSGDDEEPTDADDRLIALHPAPAVPVHPGPLAPRRVAAALGPRLDVRKFVTPGGHEIRVDARNTFGVHCHIGGHNIGRVKCKFDRVGAKGPVGQMLAWAEHGPPPASRALHFDMKNDNAVLTYDIRKAWREWAEIHMPELVDFEAACRGGDRSEPLVVT
jgi:hypothetical protein